MQTRSRSSPSSAAGDPQRCVTALEAAQVAALRRQAGTGTALPAGDAAWSHHFSVNAPVHTHEQQPALHEQTVHTEHAAHSLQHSLQRISEHAARMRQREEQLLRLLRQQSDAMRAMQAALQAQSERLEVLQGETGQRSSLNTAASGLLEMRGCNALRDKVHTVQLAAASRARRYTPLCTGTQPEMCPLLPAQPEENSVEDALGSENSPGVSAVQASMKRSRGQTASDLETAVILCRMHLFPHAAQ